MRIVFSFLCLAFLMAFRSTEHFPYEHISGLWSEHWLESDVEEVDTLRFNFKENDLKINLHNKQENWQPRFHKVSFDGSILSFRMDANNITNFYIFQLSKDQKRFEGKVHTWDGEIIKIYLQKEQ